MCSLPSVRSFVVVNFDPVATVSHLDNPELTAACKRLETKKYAAYISLAVGAPARNAPYRSHLCYIVHQGLRKNEAKGITEEMSVPILPNTSHPSSRRPIHPDKPLPWDNCYISEGFFTAARFPTIFLTEVPKTRIEVPMKEARSMEHYMMQDKEEMEDFTDGINVHDAEGRSNRHEDEGSRNQDDASHGGITGEEIHQEPDKHPPANNGTHSEHPNEQNIHDDDDDDAGSTKSDLDPIEEHNAIVMRQVVLNASFDLSEVEKPNDPADLFEEIQVFRQLYEDLEVGRKDRDIERARQVDEAYFANLPQTGKTKTSQTETEPSAKASRIQLYRSKVWSKVKGSIQTIKRRLFCM